jgi:hypothetical protein
VKEKAILKAILKIIILEVKKAKLISIIRLLEAQ